MICVSVFYPYAADAKFDHGYYAQHHMPLVMNRCKSFGMTRYEIDQGLAGGAPGSSPSFVCVGRLYFNTIEEFQNAMAAHRAEIIADVTNYTDIRFQIQVSEVTSQIAG